MVWVSHFRILEKSTSCRWLTICKLVAHIIGPPFNICKYFRYSGFGTVGRAQARMHLSLYGVYCATSTSGKSRSLATSVFKPSYICGKIENERRWYAAYLGYTWLEVIMYGNSLCARTGQWHSTCSAVSSCRLQFIQTITCCDEWECIFYQGSVGRWWLFAIDYTVRTTTSVFICFFVSLITIIFFYPTELDTFILCGCQNPSTFEC